MGQKEKMGEDSDTHFSEMVWEGGRETETEQEGGKEAGKKGDENVEEEGVGEWTDRPTIHHCLFLPRFLPLPPLLLTLCVLPTGVWPDHLKISEYLKSLPPLHSSSHCLITLFIACIPV